MFFALVKIVSGIFCILQGRGTLQVTKPILQDYKVAQITGRIQMTERKASKVEVLMKLVKKIIWISVVGGFFTIIASKNFFHDEAYGFIDQYYSTMNSTNVTTLYMLEGGCIPEIDGGLSNHTLNNQTLDM